MIMNNLTTLDEKADVIVENGTIVIQRRYTWLMNTKANPMHRMLKLRLSPEAPSKLLEELSDAYGSLYSGR